MFQYQPIKTIHVSQYQPIKTRVKETEKVESYRRTTLIGNLLNYDSDSQNFGAATPEER